MSVAALIRAMSGAGAPAEAIALAVEALEAVRNGAGISDRIALPSRSYDFTLGGVSG